VPLRKHFAHLALLATVSHLILCLLHSAPMQRKSLQLSTPWEGELLTCSCSSSSLRRFCAWDSSNPLRSPIKGVRRFGSEKCLVPNARRESVGSVSVLVARARRWGEKVMTTISAFPRPPSLGVGYVRVVQKRKLRSSPYDSGLA
jgi:hypothetical protein